MPLYEYRCQNCKHSFEEIRSVSAAHDVSCPKCGAVKAEKLLSRFAVSGQGDQRESTQHGCHGCHGHVAPSSGSSSGSGSSGESSGGHSHS